MSRERKRLILAARFAVKFAVEFYEESVYTVSERTGDSYAEY